MKIIFYETNCVYFLSFGTMKYCYYYINFTATFNKHSCYDCFKFITLKKLKYVLIHLMIVHSHTAYWKEKFLELIYIFTLKNICFTKKCILLRYIIMTVCRGLYHFKLWIWKTIVWLFLFHNHTCTINTFVIFISRIA